MSLFLLTSSPKHCAKNGSSPQKRCRKSIYALSTFFLSALCIVFLVWMILHPSKPRFHLQEAEVYQLALSATRLLTSSIELTLVSENPNRKVGVLYDQLQAYASYKGQQITQHVSLPPFYQGHQDSNLLTASLRGDSLPVASSFGYDLGRDRQAGRLPLAFRLNGRLRWKVGTWVSGHYNFNVQCTAFLALGRSPLPAPAGSVQGAECSTEV